MTRNLDDAMKVSIGGMDRVTQRVRCNYFSISCCVDHSHAHFQLKFEAVKNAILFLPQESNVLKCAQTLLTSWLVCAP